MRQPRRTGGSLPVGSTAPSPVSYRRCLARYSGARLQSRPRPPDDSARGPALPRGACPQSAARCRSLPSRGPSRHCCAGRRTALRRPAAGPRFLPRGRLARGLPRCGHSPWRQPRWPHWHSQAGLGQRQWREARRCPTPRQRPQDRRWPRGSWRQRHGQPR